LKPVKRQTPLVLPKPLQAQSPAYPTGESFRIHYRLKIRATKPMQLVRRPDKDIYVFPWRLF
jgi:hypothetical protein